MPARWRAPGYRRLGRGDVGISSTQSRSDDETLEHPRRPANCHPRPGGDGCHIRDGVGGITRILKNLPDTFSGSGAGGKLRSLAKEVIEWDKCTIHGEVKSASKGENDKLDCTGSKALGFQANSLGDVAGTILADVLPFAICYIKEGIGEALEAGLYIEKLKVHVEVPATGQLINLEGSMIGKITPLNTATSKFTFEFNEGGSSCKVGTNTLKASLTTSSDAKHEKLSGTSLIQMFEVTFTKEHELDG
jgi:hypothetical protein